MIDRPSCIDDDRQDPLSAIRDAFELSDGLVYLDGNSLGPPLKGVRDHVARVLEDWATHLIGGWWDDGWLNLPLRVGAMIEPILGAEQGTVVCGDSTSVNLFKTAMAACRLTQGHLLTDADNFPTDLYILRSVAQLCGRRLVEVSSEELRDAITDDVGVVAATHVDFRTGARHDLVDVTRLAHLHGAVVVWDLSHSAGAMPVDLAANDVDFAVGCGYKFLNGGPGAPAYLYAAKRWHAEMTNPVTGWFGHLRPFEFTSEFIPAEGVERMRVGTPDILSMAALEAALVVWEGVDLDQVRRKSVALTRRFIDLVDQELGSAVEVLTPRDECHRGSQVSLRLEGAEKLIADLIGDGVIGDFRRPDVARFGLAPLYTRFVDVWDAVSAIRRHL